MNNNLKTKDILLIALLTAVYMILGMVSMVIIMPLGAFGHCISPGIYAIFTGTIIYFIARKVGKMWQFSFLTLLLMGVFAIMGGGYLPWFISSMITAIIADFISSRSNKTSVFKIAISSGLMHVGQALGAIIPAMFFAQRFKETWIKRGQTLEQMNEQIKYASGIFGILGTVIVFVLAFIGVYIGYFILRKHFNEK